MRVQAALICAGAVSRELKPVTAQRRPGAESGSAVRQ
jgi:hypothetical protein